ncbi:MAG: hypothetical protein A3D92_09080 [Bacteroidetes bacterium RIFCSPHIGHO2_02_FULL_44_7]|nr:MAG: hypothetical protein A3D92_09080 [Bacteroidetes bacterium RIFCSPHIGHO2_02_FULL_44_7]
MPYLPDPELDFMMRNRPNIYGNSLLIFLLKLIAWLLALGCVVMGIYFASNAGLLESHEQSDQDLSFAHSHLIYAVASFLLALTMMVIVWFGRMLIRRNQFIMALEEWYQKQMTAQNEKKK